MSIKDVQSKIKAGYKQNPQAAKVTLRAKGSEAADSAMSCSVDIGRAIFETQAHAGVGGPGTAACSGDLLLGALAGCAQITAQLVAEAMGIVARSIEVTVEGDLDLRGTLGIDRSAPVGFTDIRLTLEVDADLTDEELDSYHRKVERYCVVLQTLLTPPKVDSVVQKVSSEQTA